VVIKQQMRLSGLGGDNPFGEPNYYPPPVRRQRPSWHVELPQEIFQILSEVYAALASDSRRLALMGLRTVLDIYIVDKIGDAGGFKEKLKQLREKGEISEHGAELLDAAIEAGSAAIHRGFKPEQKHLETVLEIVENLLRQSALKPSAKKVMDAVPKRKQKRDRPRES
jgi:hypothetical protein